MTTGAQISRLLAFWNEYKLNGTQESKNYLVMLSHDLLEQPEARAVAIVVVLARWHNSINLEALALTRLRLQAPDIYEILNKPILLDELIDSFLNEDRESNKLELFAEVADRHDEPVYVF